MSNKTTDTVDDEPTAESLLPVYSRAAQATHLAAKFDAGFEVPGLSEVDRETLKAAVRHYAETCVQAADAAKQASYRAQGRVAKGSA